MTGFNAAVGRGWELRKCNPDEPRAVVTNRNFRCEAEDTCSSSRTNGIVPLGDGTCGDYLRDAIQELKSPSPPCLRRDRPGLCLPPLHQSRHAEPFHPTSPTVPPLPPCLCPHSVSVWHFRHRTCVSYLDARTRVCHPQATGPRCAARPCIPCCAAVHPPFTRPSQRW